VSETVDIIVKESGSAAAATNVRSVGAAAAATRAQMDQLLLSMNGSNLKLAEIARATGSVEQQMQLLGRSTRGAADGHKVHNEQMAHGTELAGRAREALVALGLALGVHEWIELTDAYQQNINGLVQVTESQQNLVEVQRALKEVSMDTFSSLDANTNLFVKLSKAGKELNINQEQMVTVIKNLNNGLRLAGNTTADAGRAIQQLSIAMMTGEGSSRAMLSIMRQMPDLTQALAAKFFNGRDAVLQFKHAVEQGTIPIRNVMIALTGLENGFMTEVDSVRKATEAAKSHATGMQTDAEKSLIAKGTMIDLSKAVDGTAQKTMIAEHRMYDFSKGVEQVSSHSTQAATSLHGASEAITTIGRTSTASLGAVNHGIITADDSASKFTKQIQKMEPTVAQAWQNVKNALFSYVGEADQASGASEHIAHGLVLAAQNGRLFFGALGVITAFLGAYTVAAGAAYVGTILFTTAFSRVALAVSIVAALVVALYTFGQSVKLTADSSISALGAVLAVFNLLYQGVKYVWDLVLQAPGYWGPAILAVGGLTIAMRVLLGVNIILWLGNIITYMGALALATFAALGPWGLLIVAITAAALAWAYHNGVLDSAIAKLKEKLTPVVNELIAKMKEFSKETEKSGTEAKKFGDVWTGEVARVTNGFQDGLLPAVKNVDAILAKLKDDAVRDMAVTKTAVTDVAAALNTTAAAAQQADSAVSKVSSKTPGGGGSDPKTYTFGGLNYYPSMNGLEQAFARAVQISNSDGNKFEHSNEVVDMIRKFGFGGSWDMTMQAEIANSMRNMSDGGRNYLKTIFPWIPGLQYGGNFTVGGNGGTDSQLVQFMATPGEQVNVSTPAPKGTGGTGGNGGVNVNMIVVAQDANSFNRSQRQIVTSLQSQLTRVAMRQGG
jgi:tape measure domain-containing protein